MKTPKVILIDVIDPQTDKVEALKSMEELENLVDTYGGFVIIKKVQKKQIPNYKTYIGSGKLTAIIEEAKEKGVSMLIFNNLLKPQQLFNIQWRLEKEGIKVWDRVDLILKIFEKHASTSEAKLQIELAALRHMGPRIFGMGLELSRQAAGIGTRGKGETNVEIMKRHLANQEKKIREKLAKVQKMHEGQRRARKRKGLKTVAIVGYTNAGKSQLLSALTEKKVKVKNELFATLDTRIGRLYLPQSHSQCLLSDTIGFIQKLPPDLIDAFKSTLDEAIHADLLLHVVDYSDKKREMKIRVVQAILEELGVSDTPTLMVCNKMDAVKKPATKTFERKYKKQSPTFISALQKVNLGELVGKVEGKIISANPDRNSPE